MFHREGILFYINGEEVFRVNIGYYTSVMNEVPATNIFSSPRYTRFSVSSNILRNGTNVLAAEIHLHTYSPNKVDFNVIAHLIGITKLRQVSPFPIIKATSDYVHANHIVNSYNDLHYIWSGRNNGSLITLEPFLTHSYVNTVELTRSVNCIPSGIEIWGLFGDFEEEGNFVFRETLLKQDHLLNWEHRSTIELKINSQYAGYRGYQIRFNTGISAADCIHIEHINFFASKQVNCIYHQNVINIGDFVRYSCNQNYYGIISKACVQTGTGSSWGEPTEYCCIYCMR